MTDRAASGPVWENSGVVNIFQGQVHASGVVFGGTHRISDDVLDLISVLRERVTALPAGEHLVDDLDALATELRRREPDRGHVHEILGRLTAETRDEGTLTAAVADLASRIAARL
ncbi:hypothetical protein AB0F72_21570 [Actinoplanes sp. NPDC023936]|uniref:hypothetical protein n=1 Tax=Actinoplanes sp. NPDC023936 TaxID=3154910 RepID=UPI0033FCD8D3